MGIQISLGIQVSPGIHLLDFHALSCTLIHSHALPWSHHSPSQCITVHHSASQCITVHHNASQCITVNHSASLCVTMHHNPSDSHLPPKDGDRWKTSRIDLRRYRGQFRGGLSEEIPIFWAPTQKNNCQKMGCSKRSREQFPMVAGETPQK